MYMTSTTNPLLRMKVANTIVRKGVFYYQRAVPKDLRDRYPNPLIKVSLKTPNPHEAAKKVAKLNQKNASLWEAMRRDKNVMPETTRDMASTLVKDFGLQYGPTPYTENSEMALLELMEQRLESFAKKHGLEPDNVDLQQVMPVVMWIH